ncbi:unnamed protein product [Thlaspi arvense]|uniref:Myb-like domain-containing protein n=1 Tax=Thlaspi arvense TaxID=13288 RepID=A0AAU9S7W5_THLAR|nr:unnamed protein product [Thlaspi arvense]
MVAVEATQSVYYTVYRFVFVCSSPLSLFLSSLFFLFEMDKRRRRQSKAKASCSEEVSSIEWEAVKMSEEEEDLISRMYKLIGDRWELIAGRIPGRTPEEIERYWLMKHGVVFANRRRDFVRR